MPRFYFDTYDGHTLQRDAEGLECADQAMAREEALRVLPDLAREGMPNGDRLELSASVRDSKDNVIYRAILSLDGHWEA